MDMPKKHKANDMQTHMLKATSISRVFYLLATNGFRVNKNIKKWLFPTLWALLRLTHVRTLTRGIDRIIFNRRIKQTTITKAPIFVLGHWRSGTSYLHDFLSQDRQYSFTSTYQVFFPGNFLSAAREKERIAETFPKKRPMDEVEMDFDLPYEEEFAMQILTPYSFYNCWFFPRKMKTYFDKYIFLDNIGERALKKWKNCYLNFLKKVSYANQGKQLILKSPTNTGRIKLLLEMFPEAKFIYIARNPLEVYYSMSKVYNILFDQMAFQKHDPDQLKKNIIDFYQRLLAHYDEEKQLIPQGRLYELSYENFAASPVTELKKIYEVLQLPGYQEALSDFEAYYHSKKSYNRSTYQIAKEDEQLLRNKWAEGFAHWESLNNIY